MAVENYELYKTLVDNIPGLFYQFYARDDGRRGFHFLSPKITELMEIENYTPENILDKLIERIIPEHREPFIQSIDKAVKEIRKWEFEFCMTGSSRKQMWFSGISNPQRSCGETVFNGILFDITERKKSEIELSSRIALHNKCQSQLWSFVNDSRFFSRNFEENLDELIGIASGITNADRISFWKYNEDMTSMKCISLRGHEKISSEKGEILNSSNFKNYTLSLKMGNIIDVEDVFTDPRTLEIPLDYFHKNRIFSLIDAPIWIKGRLFGVLCCEYCGAKKRIFHEDRLMAIAFASCLAYCYEAGEKRRAELALEKRTVAFTRPIQDSGSITLDELFNLEDIQKLQDQFTEATGVASVITDTNGVPITVPSNFCRLCKSIIRCTEKGLKNCYKSDAIIGRYNPDGPVIQPCLSGGLWDAGASICVGGVHVANWLIGQVRDETQTEEKMAEYARKIGADETEFLKAFYEVTAMSIEKFEKIARFLFNLAGQLSLKAYQNIQQARFIQDKLTAEEALKKLNCELELKVSMQVESIRLANEELNHVNRELNKTIENLSTAQNHLVSSEKMAALGQLAAGIAHELNTPLGAIVSSSRSLNEYINFKLHRLLDFLTSLDSHEMHLFKLSLNESMAKPPESIINSDRKARVATRRALENMGVENSEFIALMLMNAGIDPEFLGNISFFKCARHSDILSNIADIASMRALFKIISGAAEKSSHVVNALRSYLQNEENGENETVDIENELDTLLTLFYNAAKHGIIIEKKYCGNAKIICHRQKLNQVWMNLINNSIQAMSFKGKLLIETERINGILRTSITDSGGGIPESIKDRIFDPFFTTKKRGEGIGLGLDICKKIIEKFEGKIYFESSHGKTKFSVELPADIK